MKRTEDREPFCAAPCSGLSECTVALRALQPGREREGGATTRGGIPLFVTSRDTTPGRARAASAETAATTSAAADSSTSQTRMLGGGFKAERLRVNLRLVINRLKLLEKKKTELAQKSRKEIADYLASGKDERARIRVEHIIREDYLVEAMEILELYCDLLLTRFGLIQSLKNLDPGLQEAVSTLIWAAPRLQSEVTELKIVSDQLCAKYSKEFGKLCRTNEIGTVSERLMHKLGVAAPPKILVERYLIEIAKNYNVPYEADAMVNPEVCEAEEANLIDMKNDKKPGSGGSGGGGGFMAPPAASPMPIGFSFPPPKGSQQPMNAPVGFGNFPPPAIGGQAPQLPTCPPSYESVTGIGPSSQSFGSAPLPELPSVPNTAPAGPYSKDASASDDIDFDDLTRRFEELKKKT
uniref:IST1 homolog n=2 Tax=Scleropages formosus TaxID=113540 RepID=A0A8C9S4X4_SCLFO